MYTRSLSKSTGIAYTELRQEITQAAQEILAKPEEYSFSFDGFIVSSSNDPYFLIQTAGAKVLDKFLHISPEQKTQISLQGFLDSYPNVPVYFREGAKEAIEDLQVTEGIQPIIVTNSSPRRAEGIFQKLLGNSHEVAIKGDAQKMKINPQWRRRGMPAEVHILDSHIPALLQRQLYFKALFSICGGDFRQIDSVWGDNGRLDLILPQHIKRKGQKQGIFTGLITSSITNPLEQKYFSGQENGTAIATLAEIAPNIRQRRKP